MIGNALFSCALLFFMLCTGSAPDKDSGECHVLGVMDPRLEAPDAPNEAQETVLRAEKPEDVPVEKDRAEESENPSPGPFCTDSVIFLRKRASQSRKTPTKSDEDTGAATDDRDGEPQTSDEKAPEQKNTSSETEKDSTDTSEENEEILLSDSDDDPQKMKKLCGAHIFRNAPLLAALGIVLTIGGATVLAVQLYMH